MELQLCTYVFILIQCLYVVLYLYLFCILYDYTLTYLCSEISYSPFMILGRLEEVSICFWNVQVDLIQQFQRIYFYCVEYEARLLQFYRGTCIFALFIFNGIQKSRAIFYIYIAAGSLERRVCYIMLAWQIGMGLVLSSRLFCLLWFV